MVKFKTSISLPAAAEVNWKQHRRTIQQFLSAHIRRCHSEKLRRIGLLQFNDCSEGFVRFNVYWNQATYDQLHAVARALRISVSHLLWRILNFVLSGEQLESVFSNYVSVVREWSRSAFIHTEIIRFVHNGAPAKRSKPDRRTP